LESWKHGVNEKSISSWGLRLRASSPSVASFYAAASITDVEPATAILLKDMVALTQKVKRYGIVI